MGPKMTNTRNSVLSAGKRQNRRLQAIVVGLVLTILSGCFSAPKVLTRDITIEVAPEANDNSPIAVDLVLVYSDVALSRVAAMAPGEWFERRGDILAAFPQEVTVMRWEVVPGQRLRRMALPDNVHGAAGALLLARYNARNAQRESVGALPNVVVDLGRAGMSVRAGKPVEEGRP
jgi:type VI secretion system protein